MLIVETSVFTKLIKEYFDDEEYIELQNELVQFPDVGEVIKGSGGLRKLRWKSKMKGKRGGYRIIYFWKTDRDLILMIYVYQKNKQDDLSRAELKQLRKIIEQDYK